MMKSEASRQVVADAADRNSTIRKIVDDCLRRRAAGEAVSDEEILEAYPDFMPELAEELRVLGIVAQAEHRANHDTSVIEGDRARPVPGRLPEWISGFQFVREINRGGQGVVYQACQQSTGRSVAIKVVHGGLHANASDQARFDREVRVLSQLNHPNIVNIHDSGVSPGGVYYVMDYIEGEPLDVYLYHREPSVDQTLALFTKICDAVNAAHTQGIIHRDLKPGNIRIDRSEEPHVLDFGLAKQVNGSSSADASWSAHTLTGQFVGSLPWASPEQAAGPPERIDIRSDVYSLGVLLFYSLTRQFPYPVEGGLQRIVDNILHTEPTRPSTLRRDVDHEVETIVFKCLAKEPGRRYQTGGELARDLRRYQAGEAIEAKRHSGGYVFRKFVARHRYISATVVLLALIVTSFGLTNFILYRQESRAHRETDDLRRRLRSELENKVSLVEVLLHAQRQHAFGWFLLAWHQGRENEARAIAASLADDTREHWGAKWLLDPKPLGRKMNGLPVSQAPEQQAFVYFVLGEHHLRDQDPKLAIKAFRQCLRQSERMPRKHPLDAGSWLEARALARIQELSVNERVATSDD